MPAAFEPCASFQRCGKCVLRDQKKKLADDKLEALDNEELKHLRQRAMVLEGKLKTQKVSLETDRVRESALEHGSPAHSGPDTEVSGSPNTKTRPMQVKIEFSWGPSTNDDVTNGEKTLTKKASRSQKRREGELQAQSEDQAKRAHEASAPKAN